MTITVKHYGHLAGSPVELMTIEALYETAQAGHLTGISINPQNEVVVAFEDGNPAAFIIFCEYDETGELWIHLGYCRPEYRRQGHYRACVQKLRNLAELSGFTRIHTATHPDNTPAIESIKARGGTIQYIGFVFPV